MKKRLASLFLALALCLGLCVPVLAANYSDVPAGHTFYDEIDWAASQYIVTGYLNGTFKPSQTVTKNHFVAMIARAFYLDEIVQYETPEIMRVYGAFGATNMTLAANGTLKNTSFSDTYLTEAIFTNINRYDMAQLITNVMNKAGFFADSAQKQTAIAKIQDYYGIPAQYKDAVASVYALGIIGGYADGAFHGEGVMNRGQAAAVIYRMMQRMYKNAGNQNPPETKPVETGPDTVTAAPSVPAGDLEKYPETRCISCNYLMRQAGSLSLDLNMDEGQAGRFHLCDLCNQVYVCGQCSKHSVDASLSMHRHKVVCGTGETMIPMTELFSPYYKNSVYYQRLKNVTLTGDYRRDILAVAESQIGYTEGNDETQLDGSHKGRKDYTEYNWFIDGYAGAPWCSEFASWCARQANIPTSILHGSSAAVADDFGGTAYSWQDTVFAGGSYMPQPGDLMLVSRSRSSEISTSKALDHTTIVECVSQNGEQVTITVIDGNSNNGVRRHDYYYSTSKGLAGYFVAPDYDRG